MNIQKTITDLKLKLVMKDSFKSDSSFMCGGLAEGYNLYPVEQALDQALASNDEEIQISFLLVALDKLANCL